MLKIAEYKQAKSSFCRAPCKRTGVSKRDLKKEFSDLVSILSFDVSNQNFLIFGSRDHEDTKCRFKHPEKKKKNSRRTT
jgi:hypothetical protein